MNRIFIKDFSVCHAMGDTLQSFADSLFGKTPEQLLKPYNQLISGRSTFVSEIENQLPPMPDSLSDYKSRNNQLALKTLASLNSQILAAIEKYGSQRIGIVAGTSTSGIREGELFYQALASNKETHFKYEQQEIGNLSFVIANHYAINGPAFTISTACSSSTKTVAAGARLIQNGLCDAVIVGGSDTLCKMTLNGFDSLESVDGSITNPMSLNRKGINIGEGAGFFLLTKEPSSFEVLGFGESSDGYHISSPDPEGAGAEIAIKDALKMSQLSPSDIGYINLHGTGTQKNDQFEARLIDRLFGVETPISSTKPLTGHTLGAAGALDLAICLVSLSSEYNSQKIAPPHHWDGQHDEDLPKVNLCDKQQKIMSRDIMTNNFAFGGNNASLVIRGHEHV